MTNVAMRFFIGVAILLAATTSQAQVTTDVVCSYAPSQSAIVNRITSGIGGAGVGAEAILLAAGLTAVQHSGGGYIFTGTTGYVSGTLGYAIVAPVLVTASVVVAGSAIALELTCMPKNHPDAVKKVKEITAEFQKGLVAANNHAIDVRDAAGNKIRGINNQAIDLRDAAVIEFRDGTAQLFAKGKAFVGTR